jgi:hypothetical protein
MKLSRRWDRRKGVAGIFSIVLFFGLLFTVGFGFYQTAINDQNTSANAYSQRLSLQAQASHENLTLMAGSGASNGVDFLWLMVNNTGGTDSVVTSIYVSSLKGEVLTYSVSSGSPFLSTTNDLNRSLPITLAPGVSTSEVGGNIEILPSALTECKVITSTGCEGQTVYVSILTKLGNVFSVSFPPQNSVTEKNILVNQGLLDEYLVSQNVLSVNQLNIINGCTGCVNGSYSGGNILVLLLTATPSPVQQGGIITVSANVSDYSAYAANSVSVVLNATYTGSATVSPNIAPTVSPNYECASIPTIASGKSETVTCKFSANEGNLGGGTVTFAGEATACVATGKGTNSPCSASTPGTPAASSVTSSNPVQVGAAISYGLWQPNFFVFYYTGCSGSTCTGGSCQFITQHCGAGVIPSSETYVAVYVQVTNVGTQPLTLLDGSYIQSVSPNVEFDLFMACSGAQASICNFNGYSTGVDYTASSGTISAYGCGDSAPAAPAESPDAPSGQTCLTVSQGQSVTLMFAAGSPDSNALTWGKANPGGTGGENAAILLDFAACISSCSGGGGTYQAASQQIPFEGVVVP